MIRQFDVFENPSHRLREQVAYIVTVQSHFLEALRTTVVAPLFRRRILAPDQGIILPVQLGDEDLSLNVALLANIDARMLRRALGSLGSYELEIRRAIDRLLTGF